MSNFIPALILNELVIFPNQETKIDISNETSKKVIKSACKSGLDTVMVIPPKLTSESSPLLSDLSSIGVIAKIKSHIELSNGNLRVILRGIERCKITKYYQNSNTGVIKCDYEKVELPELEDKKKRSILKKLNNETKKYINLNAEVSNSIISAIDRTNNLSTITDIIASFMPFEFIKKIYYMETINPYNRAQKLIEDLQDEIEVSTIDKELDERLQSNIENGQREYILKEKLREINKILGNTKDEEISYITSKIEKLNLDTKVNNKLMSEISKYSSISDYSPEAAVIKTYIDTLINLPWNTSSNEITDIKSIKKSLDDALYGLDEVKDRIIEYSALKESNPNLKSPVICLVGPPGVGKTKMAMSISKALNREFYKISVGGLNDSTELIGTRRTYLGAQPGKIIQCLIKVKTNNPVILIDEVDKMVKDYKGDPASTLLEILDETQNKSFVDNYIEEEFDLSHILFVLTANNIEDIPFVLRDRLEIIKIDSYTLDEKIDIAKHYLLKEINQKYSSDLKINKDVLSDIIVHYTEEYGVRDIKRILDKLVRKMLVNKETAKQITSTIVNKYLTNKITFDETKIKDFGVCNILACSQTGGVLTKVEVVALKGNGNIKLTGLAGEILTESVQISLGMLANKYHVDINKYDFYINFLNGSIKKDGPSAGLAISMAIYSLFYRKKLSSDVAYTGEVSLSGNIYKVGGIKEKILAAYLNHVKTIYIPKDNEEDLKIINKDILEKIDVKLVSHFDELFSNMI